MARSLIATWRRLFTPRPSPALEQLLGSLATTPYVWHLTPAGKLRAREHGAELCPVTGVVRYRARVVYGVGDWVRAAAQIGLSYADACLVVQAADVPRPPSARLRALRQRLLAATRLASARTTAPEHDAMDRALARLLATPAALADPLVDPRQRDETPVLV